jgi:hypothetical protein
MRRLTILAMVLAVLGAVAGCGQSACQAHPGGLGCEEEQKKHREAEAANRTKEEQNTPQAKEERSRKEQEEAHETAHEWWCKKWGYLGKPDPEGQACSTSELSGEQVAEKVTAKAEPSGRLGGNEKFSCPEGKYAGGSHLVCTLTGSNGSQEFEVTLGSGTVEVAVKGEGGGGGEGG